MTAENHRVKAAWPNKPNSAKPAIARQFHFGGLWRGLADSERYFQQEHFACYVRVFLY